MQVLEDSTRAALEGVPVDVCEPFGRQCTGLLAARDCLNSEESCDRIFREGSTEETYHLALVQQLACLEQR
jgi:hypothetical protein